MHLLDLARCSRDLAATPSRRAKVERLATLLRRLQPVEVEIAVGLLLGSPRQAPLKLGGATVAAAGVEPAAEASLDLAAVDAALTEIAGTGGRGAVAARSACLASLLARATPIEQDFLHGALLGGLRQGAVDGLVLEAVAEAAQITGDALRQAAMLTGDLRVVAKAALTEGAAGVARFGLSLFRPVLPMLAQPAESLDVALARLGEGAFEWKLDGARIQVHKRGAEVRIFTRRCNDVTASMPEIVAAMRELPADELILDGEAIALRPDGTPLPFQTTMRRFGRRRGVAALAAELPLSAFCFDCLLLDGRGLLGRPASERFAALDASVPAGLRVPRVIGDDPAMVSALWTEALAAGHEGLMAKSLSAPYAAGARGGAWLKLKPVHSLDLVVLGAEWGNGRRSGWLSNLHLGARDPGSGGFVMLGKTFKGLSDELLAWQTHALLSRELGREGVTVHVRPELVVEIAFSDVQRSPQYPGGVALRFARVKRYRDDKSPAEVDTIEAVRALLPKRI